MRLLNKTAIITGAAGGMGMETVKRFLEEGASVAATDINTKRLISEMGEHPNLLTLQADLNNEAEVEELVYKAVNRFGTVDRLVNIAGIAQRATPVEDVTIAEWHRILDTNVTAAFLTSKFAIPVMKKNGNGAIVNISSISAVRPRPGLNAYIVSKGAILSLTSALAIELASDNIRVNAINPGPAETDMLGQFAAADADAETVKNSIFKDSVPMGSLIQPDDIANAIVYLCSDEAKMVTGAILNVDGGRGL
ncbi:SDR family NAD(P)-dependent oxidoreductase [Cytobacillus purgationiresistens]|nr:SDR family oxidoreductase [Cytobacillus purgationiresistens]